MTDHKILVVSTYAEAERLGAKSTGGKWGWLYLDDWRIVSAHAGPHAIEGLRVSEFKFTERALEHRNAPEIHDMLECSKLKMRRCSECGKIEGSFACKIRHIQLNTGDAKAAKD